MGAPSKFPKLIAGMTVAAIIIFSIWLYFFLCVKKDFEALSALFSGLAFVCLIGTFLLQRQELKDTKKANQRMVEMSRRSIEAQYHFYMLQLIGPQEEDRRKTYEESLSKKTELLIKKHKLETTINNFMERKEHGEYVDTELTAAEISLKELIPYCEAAQKSCEMTKKHWMEYDTRKAKIEALIEPISSDGE